jgi:hypothetical protein
MHIWRQLHTLQSEDKIRVEIGVNQRSYSTNMDPHYVNHTNISINAIPNLIEIRSVVSEMKGKWGRTDTGFLLRDRHINLGKGTRKTVNVHSSFMLSNLVINYMPVKVDKTIKNKFNQNPSDPYIFSMRDTPRYTVWDTDSFVK